MNATKPKIGRGTPPPQKWSFLEDLPIGQFAEETDLSKYAAIRTAASRAGKRLKRKYRVCREKDAKGREVIRIYRTK